MIVDVNVLFGRWPFWNLRYEKDQGILTLMDRAGIDKALVSSLDSVFLVDYERGNREVAHASNLHSNRLIAVAVINLNFSLWKQHLRFCVEEYGIRGIKLHPDYHKYDLLGEEAADLMEEAKRLNLPVYLQTSLMDTRVHPGYCFVPETSMLEVSSAINRYRENKIIVGGAKHFGSRVRELLGQVGRSKNFYIETSGIGGPIDGIEELVEAIGSSKLLFGTRMPLLYPEAAKLMIEKSNISKEDKQNILGCNAEELFQVTN